MDVDSPGDLIFDSGVFCLIGIMESLDAGFAAVGVDVDAGVDIEVVGDFNVVGVDGGVGGCRC